MEVAGVALGFSGVLVTSGKPEPGLDPVFTMPLLLLAPVEFVGFQAEANTAAATISAGIPTRAALRSVGGRIGAVPRSAGAVLGVVAPRRCAGMGMGLAA